MSGEHELNASGKVPAGTREAEPLLLVLIAVAVPVVLVALAAGGGGTPLLVLALVAIVIVSAGIAVTFARLTTGGQPRDETDFPRRTDELASLRASAARRREPSTTSHRRA